MGDEGRSRTCARCGEFEGSVDCCAVVAVADALVRRWGPAWQGLADVGQREVRTQIQGDALAAVAALRDHWEMTNDATEPTP